MAFSMLFGLSVPASPHGSVDGFFQAPQKETSTRLSVNVGASGSDQHDQIEIKVIYQRKSGTSWIRIHDVSVYDNDSRGFTAGTWEDCEGTATGTATYRSKVQWWWRNNDGDTAHEKGPQFSNGVSIPGTSCYNDFD
jgi:hypothetical protein